MNKMNRKGVVGKTMASIPVLLVIVFVMAVFVAGSVFMKSLKKPEEQLNRSYFKVNSENPLLKTIEVEGQRFMVVDVLSLSNSAKEDLKFYYAFLYALSDLVKNEGDCLFISSGKLEGSGLTAFGSYSGIAFKKGLPCKNYVPLVRTLTTKILEPKNICELDNTQLLGIYQKAGILSETYIPVDGKKAKVEYYLGKCLSEGGTA